MRVIDQDTEVFVNGAAIAAQIKTMGNNSVLTCQLPEEISIEDFKNLDIKILAITDKDAMDCEFNLVCTGDD
ncbi:MAG: hypothetical protein MJ200_04445 [Mycoplasmoidaceae bacterium]|nr:hypothetical protein [Mycoplasmoidaceae bacterium]